MTTSTSLAAYADSRHHHVLADTYGLWTVLGGTEHRRRRAACVTCRCACGTERSVTTWSLRNGASTSCGCNRPQQTKHPLYVRYRSMLDRCHSPGNKRYPEYGARGIYVCARWRESFAAYVEDVGLPPKEDMQVDRIDNDGPYSPENCRWADRVTQMRNMRRNHELPLNGETLCVSEWAKRLGVWPSAIDSRLAAGWSVEEALTRPPHRGKRPASGPTSTVRRRKSRAGAPAS